MMMSNPVNPSQQKLAEKLIILNDRAIGMLTRIYNIKKACSDPKSKPQFLSERSLESALKQIAKKFPLIDARNGGAAFQAVHGIRQDVIKSLSLYYYTFADLLDLKDHISELLTTMAACQVEMDITLNFDLTASYLNLVVNYISLMILLSRVDDRKAVLGLFNAAYDIQNGKSDVSFPRLGQMIVEYDPPLKKLSEDFIPHQKLLLGALYSLGSVYLRRNLTVDKWRQAQMLSLVAASQQLLYTAQTDTIPCEYLSLDTMDRWIIFGLTVCSRFCALSPSQLSSELSLGGGEEAAVLQGMWTKALDSSLTVRLFRDETVNVHQYIQAFFDGVKGYNKRVSEIKELYKGAVQNAGFVHRERRKFLRTALKELYCILSDQPGLLGPKVLFVFMALSFSRDEVAWLLRHAEHLPAGTTKAEKKAGAKLGWEDVLDRQLPELLFYMDELRQLVYKYAQVIQRYYIQFLSGYDALTLHEHIRAVPSLSEDESDILSSFCNQIAELSVQRLDAAEVFDFRGLRLDWCRLQAYTSVASDRSQFHLKSSPKLAYAMNTTVFHLKMVDFLDEMVRETSDLSIYCFYTKQLEKQFQLCLEFPSQTRYICAFPRLCTHFMNSLHELCPEERMHIGEKSLSFCNLFLEEMAKEAKNIVTNTCDRQCVLADQLLPKHCSRLIGQTMEQQRKLKEGKHSVGADQYKQMQVEMPGDESRRKSREQLTLMDKLHVALTELCFSINRYNTIVVWQHVFAPKEYLTQALEDRFNSALVGMALYDGQRQEIAKPSEMLNSVRTYMSVLQSLENYVNIDVTRLFNNVLLQQTQPQDCKGHETVTTLYTRWYLEVLLRKVSACQILYSPHTRSFVNNPHSDAATHIGFNAEEYTDVHELRSLAELLGPYGIKFFSERLIWHVASQISELKKLVIQNKEVLRVMRTNFDKPERMRELFKQLTVTEVNPKRNIDVVDNVLQRVTIIGEILSFKALLQSALHTVLGLRIPFLLHSIEDFKKNFPDEHPEQLPGNPAWEAAFELCNAAGVQCNVDAALVSAIRAQMQSEKASEEDYHICCLFVVFIAVALPKLAKSDSCFYKTSIGAHLNNAHCIALAINATAGALFTLHARGDVPERMKEFLALATSSILHINQDPTERDQSRNKESVYILLDKIVEASPWLTVDILESCFPYILIRSSYHACSQQDQTSRQQLHSGHHGPRSPTDAAAT